MKTRTGVVKSETDYLQPYRVYWQGKIIYFAQTKEEAIKKLAGEKKRHP